MFFTPVLWSVVNPLWFWTAIVSLVLSSLKKRTAASVGVFFMLMIFFCMLNYYAITFFRVVGGQLQDWRKVLLAHILCFSALYYDALVLGQGTKLILDFLVGSHAVDDTKRERGVCFSLAMSLLCASSRLMMARELSSSKRLTKHPTSNFFIGCWLLLLLILQIVYGLAFVGNMLSLLRN
eukprot:gnl/TRDRNA2_/TRDRNA2_77246_c0_seq1.p1 gnl/TRDRNA2_/TRDRNA2_77246_c0~~gnl/TRDRNA2_/TRDRNA2_77246_c0_seq1.p1  ORF type:complete len:180 (-),score=12.75 gnl/TRDRNA2_/TRDRNA2_77246_c0_seq1:82-621(-)